MQESIDPQNSDYAASRWAAIGAMFRQCFNYRGRSTRSEFFWGVASLNLVVAFVERMLMRLDVPGIATITLVLGLLTLVPELPLAVRRYRDAGHPVGLAYGQIGITILYAFYNFLQAHGIMLFRLGALGSMSAIFLASFGPLAVNYLNLLIQVILCLTPTPGKALVNPDYGARGLAVIAAASRNTFNFDGVSTRREYWGYFLLLCLWVIPMAFILSLITGYRGNFGGTMNVTRLVAGLLVAIPMIPFAALSVRRYRDAGVAPWLVLIQFGVNYVLAYLLSYSATVLLRLPALLAVSDLVRSLKALVGWTSLLLLANVVVQIVITVRKSRTHPMTAERRAALTKLTGALRRVVEAKSTDETTHN